VARLELHDHEWVDVTSVRLAGAFSRTWFCVNCRIQLDQRERPENYPTPCRVGSDDDELGAKRKIRTGEL
jgi:hypothetical protein